MSKKRLLLIGSIVCLCGALVALGVLFPWSSNPPSMSELGPKPTTTVSESETQTTLTEPSKEVYQSPVDFAALQAVNPHAYAWLTVPGTPVNYPIVQHPQDDLFYLDHNIDGAYDPNGAIFSERLYNTTDFTDAVTVLYGHDMMSGAMFGELQRLYSDPTFLKENDEIIVYLPDRELHFEIFAALPYSRMHLLYYYQTQKKSAFDLFINDVYSSRRLSTQLIEERRPEFGDQVVVLSTCLSGDNHYRYLVMGVCKTVSYC